jgi:hypothetical protein
MASFRIYSEIGEGIALKVYLPRSLAKPAPIESGPSPDEFAISAARTINSCLTPTLAAICRLISLTSLD